MSGKVRYKNNDYLGKALVHKDRRKIRNRMARESRSRRRNRG
jgi:hypothetical protein